MKKKIDWCSPTKVWSNLKQSNADLSNAKDTLALIHDMVDDDDDDDDNNNNNNK